MVGLGVPAAICLVEAAPLNFGRFFFYKPIGGQGDWHIYIPTFG